MPNTHSAILLHVIFSTKHRRACIAPEMRARLYEFMGGIVRAEGGTLYAIGGVADHVHMLVRWKTDRGVGELMREVKARSSRWIHQTFPAMHDFAWQDGYGVFSIGKSQERGVKEYIARQEDHHRVKGFMDEYREFLDRYEVEYDARYLE